MTAPSHVLVVDDEPSLLRALTMNLTGRGYRVTTATTGASAVELAAVVEPDIVILDLGLPDMDGMEVLRRMRAGSHQPPVIVLSSRSATEEKVTALDLGANDYVTKPFDMNELVARLRAATRHIAEAAVAPLAVALGPITVDLADRTIRREGMEPGAIRLTPTEWKMLDVLLRRPGRLVTPTELLTAMRGGPEHTERSYLRIFMQQLRRKLEVDPSRPRHLLTEPGMGYRFMP